MAAVESQAIEARDSRRLNNFDLLRLLAAIAVLVSHSFVLTGRAEPAVGSQTVGNLAVIVFFGISGFLITRSWVHAPRLVDYLVKRVLRIYPALIVVLIVAALVVGPFASALPLSGYFSGFAPLKYVLHNLTMWNELYTLPGVFIHNPYRGSVDGSIWTIPLEFRAYLIVAALGLLGALRDRRVAIGAWVIVFVAAALNHSHQLELLGDPTFLRAFAIGSILYLTEGVVPWRWDVAVVGLIVWVALTGTSLGPWASSLAIPYAAIVAGHQTPRSWARLTQHGDFSYGVYLWAFLVQQVIATFSGVTPLEMIVIALPITYALGAASWFVVEKRALRFKPRASAPLRLDPIPEGELPASVRG